MASGDDVARVAKAVWYENYIPVLDDLPEPARRDAGYLVDRLLRYPVVPQERKKKLLKVVEAYRPQSRPSSTMQRVRDALAATWGASCDLGRFAEVLLPLQTRHAASAQSKGHKDKLFVPAK